MKNNKKRAPKGTMRRVLSYLKGYRLFLFLSLLFAALSVALTLYLPVLLGDAIDCIVGPENVDFAKIGKIFVQAAVIIGATAVFQWLMNVCNNKMTYGIVRNIRNVTVSSTNDCFYAS